MGGENVTLKEDIVENKNFAASLMLSNFLKFNFKMHDIFWKY